MRRDSVRLSERTACGVRPLGPPVPFGNLAAVPLVQGLPPPADAAGLRASLRRTGFRWVHPPGSPVPFGTFAVG